MRGFRGLRYAVLIILVLGLTISVTAQTRQYDTFEDGDYTTNPEWNLNGSASATVQSNDVYGGSFSLDFNTGSSVGEIIADREVTSTPSPDIGHINQFVFQPIPDDDGVGYYLKNYQDNILLPEDASLDVNDAHIFLGRWVESYYCTSQTGDGGTDTEILTPSEANSLDPDSFYIGEIEFTDIGQSTIDVDCRIKYPNGTVLAQGSADTNRMDETHFPFSYVSFSDPIGGNTETVLDDISYSDEEFQIPLEPPNISNMDVQPDPVNQGADINVSANIAEGDGALTSTILNLTDPSGTVQLEDQVLTSGSGDLYYYEYSVATDAEPGTWTADIYVEDNNTEFDSEAHDFTVLEVTPPEISNIDAEPDTLEQGESVNISADITDDGVVDSAELTITTPSSSVQLDAQDMTQGSGDLYFYEHTTNASAETGTWDAEINATDNDGVSTLDDVGFTVEAPPPFWGDSSFIVALLFLAILLGFVAPAVNKALK